MKSKETGWSYYIADNGEKADDASAIMIYDWQTLNDAEMAAHYASEDDWDNRDGWELGVGDGPTITVVSPDGTETQFSTYREAAIEHSVTAIS